MGTERRQPTAQHTRAASERRRGHARRRRAHIRRSAVAFALATWLFAPALRAEPHRVEVVGVYPIREAMRGKLNPRDEAIQKALWEGVSRVALELMGEEAGPDEAEPGPGASPSAGPRAPSAPGPSGERPATDPGSPRPDPSERFRKVFGRQILPYTRSFRIIEDRGERPVLFAEEPGVRSEYLVVIEVMVDVDRVRGELVRAGLIEASAGPGVSQTVVIELVGIDRYAGLRIVVDTLRRALSANRIETLEFAPRRQLLQIEGPFGPDEVAARLGRLDSAELILDPVEVDREGRRIRVLAQYFEPAPADEEETPVTAAPDASSPIRP